MLRPAVTHDDLHTLLPRYAAGELDDSDAVVVRDHLATGCPECLAAVFRPQGNGPPPHTLGAVPPASPAVGAARHVQHRASRRLVFVLGTLAVILAAATGWMIGLLATSDSKRRAEAASAAARIAELDGMRADLERVRRELETRVAEAAEARATAEAEARRQAEAAQASAEASAELRGRLESLEARVVELTRGVRSREVEIGRLLAGAEIRALGDLAATPGVQVLRLLPGPGAEDARGHVLWHPARERIMLYVFDLPDGGYRVRIQLDDGVVTPGPALRLGTHGEAATVIELGVRAARLRAVEVVREPTEDRVLEGRLPAAG